MQTIKYLINGKQLQIREKLIAGLFGILLGTFAVHKFYLGYTKTAVIQLVISLVTCGAFGIVGFIEGIIYLTKTDE